MTLTQKNRSFGRDFMISKMMLLIIFTFMVLFPISKMLFTITLEDIRQVFSSPMIGTVLLNSLQVTLTATAIVFVIAYGLSYCLVRTKMKFKGFFNVILALPMLIPSISHGMGLIILFGNNGIITRLLNLDTNIYGFWGIVIGAVLYAFPVAYLMISDILKYEDGSPYEAATVLGIPRLKQFAVITFPFLRKPLISVIFAVFTMIVTDYGVPLMVGGKFKTLSVLMYQEVIGQLNFSSGSVYGAILLMPAVISFIFDLVNKDKGNSAFVLKPVKMNENKVSLVVAYTFCGAMAIFTLLPIVSFLVLGFTKRYPSDLSFSLYNVERVFQLGGDEYLFNSVMIALCVAVIGTIIGFATAYLTARMKSKASKALHLLAITSMAIPGIVLGLSYVMVYSGSPIYGTLVILIMANLVHFIASPYLMMYNSLSKINENIEAVASTLGIKKLLLIRDVFLPQSISTLTEMFAYFFVNSMMTISAVSFLANTSTKPISLMINQFEAQMQLGNAAVVSMLILVINLVIKAIARILNKKFS